MSKPIKNPFGAVTITESAIKSAAIESALSCYGVVSITNQPLNSKIDEFFKVDPKPGVVVQNKSGSWHVSLYITVAYGLKLTEIISTVQDTVKYNLEKTFDIKFKAVNIYIVGVLER
ncbi:MAG: Asp23/Gls24 family envelope stress response protein [Bacilli bacterium]|nr:Asp23/Gls24 family envelope stress response protein [Bacilli bacterium]